jgi:4,5-dihydroxyphthalate decarboxylase
MRKLELSAVSRTHGNNRAVKDGRIAPRGVDLRFTEVPVLVNAFRRMVRTTEFDVCEMAITTYLCAKEHGKPFTALPIFLVRGFHHGAIHTYSDLGYYDIGISEIGVKDLAGRAVGVNRGYTVTTGVWARGILHTEYGLDLDRVDWVRSGDEHIAEYQPPANVRSTDANLADLLASGELAATVGVTAPEAHTLIPNAEAAGYAALRERGHYPINHLVVVRDELLHEHPDLARDLFDTFAEAKRRYVEELRADAIAEPTAADRMHREVLRITGDDPLPYGIEPNHAVLDELVDHAIDQHILRERPKIDDLFADGTRDITG